MAWTDEQKSKVVADYQAAGPTPKNSIEIVSKIAEDTEQSVNGVRMILIQAGVYIKKDEAVKPSEGTTAPKEGSKRVGKEDSVAALRAAIEAKGKDVDEDILGKLTGKAAMYFASLLT